MSNYDNHYHPNSQVSVEEMDSLYTVLDDEQAAIVAHAKLVGKQRTYRMPVNQHPAEIAALLDAAKASLTIDRAERFSDFERAHRWQNGDGNQEATQAWGIAAGVFAGQIVNHL